MTKEELEQKHAALLEEKGTLLATEDGQVFLDTPQGKRYATGHAATNRVKVFELKYKAAKKPANKKAASKKSNKEEK